MLLEIIKALQLPIMLIRACTQALRPYPGK